MSSNKKSLSLAWQMMVGLVLGIIVGAMVDSSFAQTYLQPLGTLFLPRLLQAPPAFPTRPSLAASL